MKIIKYIPLFILISFLSILIVHYFSLRSFSHLDLAPEIDKFYVTGEWGRPDVVKALPSINENSIVALGGSALVVPGNCDGKKFYGTFPDLLNNELKKRNLSVINLGYCGDDSRGALVAIDYILKTKRPKAFLLYLGHSDYSNVSREIVLSKTSLIHTDYFLKNVFAFLSPGLKFRLDHFLKNTFEAGLIKIYRVSDASLFNKDKFKSYSDLVSVHFQFIVEKIVQRCREKKVPLIFITPLGNVLYPPVAADSEVREIYRKGLETKNTELLNKAVENDYFGFDQRAKAKASEIIRKQAASDVLIVDLNADFKTKETKFYNSTFSDIFHFTEDGHKYVFHKIMSAGILNLVH